VRSSECWRFACYWWHRSLSADRFQRIFGVFGAIINSAIVDSARREWQSRPVADYNCLATRNLSADQLAAQGIGPNDPRIRGLLYECARARRYAPERMEPQQAAAVPYNHPNFVVDGLALGGAVYPNSAVYKSYTCESSDDFSGFTWCAHYSEPSGQLGRYKSSVAILHSSGNRVVFISQRITPAFFAFGDIDREIQRLSRGFGQAKILNADPRPGVPHAVLAAWGAVTLTSLDEVAMDALRRGEHPHHGLLADFIGDPHKSAQIGLPVYSIGGGPGFLWGASSDDAGKGSLGISAVDASALGPTQPAPEIVPAAPSQQPEQVAPATPSSPTEKAAVKTMDVIDFLVDWKSLIGQTVTVTGCSLIEADTSSVECSAGPPGQFSIDSNTLEREDFRRALRECAGFKEGDGCRAEVTGDVTENSIGGAKLLDAALKWAASPPAPQAPQSFAPSQQAPVASPPMPPSVSPPPEAAAPSVTPPPKTSASCKEAWRLCADNAEIANNYDGWIRAQNSCQDAAEKMAKYGTPQWPHSWIPNFNFFHKGSDYKETGRAVLIEDDAQFQNAFGAMVHSTVTCTYNLDSETVIDLSITSH
jgi:hypothetical protein